MFDGWVAPEYFDAADDDAVSNQGVTGDDDFDEYPDGSHHDDYAIDI